MFLILRKIHYLFLQFVVLHIVASPEVRDVPSSEPPIARLYSETVKVDTGGEVTKRF